MSNLSTAQAVAYALSIVVPLASSRLARAHWPSEVVGIITLALSTLTGFGAELAHAGSDFNWRSAVGLALSTFFLAVLSRYGLWKDTKTDADLLKKGSKPKRQPRHAA